MQIVNKNEIPDELTVKIEKMSNLGYGIARLNGYVIFVENACPEDILKIKLTKRNKNYAHAQITEIIQPSNHRIKPACALHKVCGACKFQHIDYDYQLKIKHDIVSELMHDINAEILPVIPSDKPSGYRRKIQYSITETKNSKKILAGYYKTGSHELVNIKYCPIQPQECDKIIEYIRENAPKYDISGYYEKKHSGMLRHVLIRSSEYNGQNLVVLVLNLDKTCNNIKNFAHALFSDFESISSVCVNFNNKKTNLILGEKSILLEGKSFIEEKLCGKIFKIGAETFFQVNPSCADKIFNYIKKYINENYKKPVILDAYAGISAFGIALSDIAEKIVCVEEVKQSVDLAERLIEENSIKNIETHCMDAADFFADIIKNPDYKFDIAIIDPPRKGCTKESLDYLLKTVKSEIIYVSCDPSTLARDLKYLETNGMKVQKIQPFDMFPHTYHIENAAFIKKC